jgi:hypothetical protein
VKDLSLKSESYSPQVVSLKTDVLYRHSTCDLFIALFEFIVTQQQNDKSSTMIFADQWGLCRL